MTRICVVPQVSGVGGMVSFKAKFSVGLQSLDIETTSNLKPLTYDSVLVIGGTRALAGLWRAKRGGVRIVQRLNGMNWLHRMQPTGVKHYLRAEYGNWLLQFIRTRLSDHIIYQSDFSRQWWERVYGHIRVPNSVVHNAVDLDTYSPELQIPDHQSSKFRILLVEGALMGGYEMGLETAVQLVEHLNNAHSHSLDRSVELIIAGRVSERVKAHWEEKTKISINWVGLVPPEKIPALDRSAHLLYSSDINAACPNSVIEALACGLPVLAFDTGALQELVTGDSGRIVPYGGDPWKLEKPHIPALAKAAVEILTNQQRFRSAARSHAENYFDLNAMLNGYLKALLV